MRQKCERCWKHLNTLVDYSSLMSNYSNYESIMKHLYVVTKTTVTLPDDERSISRNVAKRK